MTCVNEEAEMAHCTKCGTEVPATAQFCPNCGQTQPATPVQPATPWQPPAATAGAGMSENTAATLSYVLGWLTGIIFFLIDKRPYVRFHAAQSIVTFGGLHIIRVVLAMIFGFGFFFGGGYGHWGYGTLVRAVGPDPELAQEVEAAEPVPGLDGVPALERGME